MPVISLLASLIGGLGSAFSSVMGFKGEQAKTMQGALDVVKTIDNNDATSTTALAGALQVILSQGSWLEKNWRSWLMVGCMFLLFASFFGFTPPNFNDPLTPMMEKLFELLTIGLSGYIIRRGIVDVVRIFSIGSVLKSFIDKKLL